MVNNDFIIINIKHFKEPKGNIIILNNYNSLYIIYILLFKLTLAYI